MVKDHVRRISSTKFGCNWLSSFILDNYLKKPSIFVLLITMAIRDAVHNFDKGPFHKLWSKLDKMINAIRFVGYLCKVGIISWAKLIPKAMKLIAKICLDFF